MRRFQSPPFRLARPGTAVIVTALVAAACGGASSTIAPPAPTAAASAATAAVPGATPAPVASAAEPTLPSPAAIALSKTFTAKNGRTVRHPDGWAIREDMGIIYASTTQAAADRLVTLGSLEPGQVFIQFAENSILSGATADPAVHLPDNLRLLLEGGGFTASAPAMLPWAARRSARLDASNDRLQVLAVSMMVREDLFADVIAYTAPGEMVTHEALILAVIESLTYPPS